mgnify:CR=1 FL=1
MSVFALFAQKEHNLSQFYGVELGFKKGSYGSDTIQITPLEEIDTIGMRYSIEKIEKYSEYRETERFVLDSTGAVTNYIFFINCPVGEWLPTLLEFEIREDKLFMLVEYNYFHAGEEPILKEYFWNIDFFSDHEIRLSRNKK